MGIVMKNITHIIMTASMMMLALVSCKKNEIEKEVGIESEESAVEFYAESVETKTVFDTPTGTTYPTLWTDTKSIVISQNKATTITATVTPI